MGKATPSLYAGALPAGVVLGGSVSDAAALNGGANPTGTITFRLYAPGDTTCSGTPVHTSVRPIVSSQARADDYTPAVSGVFRWQATYDGDANNKAVIGLCGGASQTLTVDFQSALVTTAVPSATGLGQAVHAEATLVGANNPTGNVTFTLFRPTDTSCYDPIFTSVVPISSTGTATSESFVTVFSPLYVSLGTYSWKASYPGDANNAASVVQACGAAGQTVAVGKAQPVVTGQADPSEGRVGNSIGVTATVSGSVYLSALAIFELFPASDTTCSGAPVAAVSRSLSGGGVTSPRVSVGAGTYHWRISLGGDANNEPSSSGCGGPTQTVTVLPIVPVLTIDALSSSEVTVGQPVHATATLSGGVYSGRVYFVIYGPTSAAGPCSTSASIAGFLNIIDGNEPEDSAYVLGDGTYTSANFTPTVPGTYWWLTHYTPTNTLNGPAEEFCGPHGTLTVTEPPAGVTVDGGTLALTEAGPEQTYTVTLMSQPEADVQVAPVPSGLCTASGELTFTADNWSTPQTVTVTPGNDDVVHSQTCTITHATVSLDPAYDALQVPAASGPVADDDAAGITVTAGSLSVFEHTASSASYTLVLNSEPTSNVTIAMSAAGGDVTATSSVTFTPANWNVAQTVMITAVDDGAVEVPEETVLVTHQAAVSSDPEYSGLLAASVPVDVVDDDTATTVSAAPNPISDAGTVTLTATVAGGDGSLGGTVQFTVGGNPVGGPVALVGGAAAVVAGPFTNGVYPVEAVYTGDADNDGSSGSTSLEITATPVPDDDEFTVVEDSGSTVLDVLDGDVDDDGDTLEIVSRTAAGHGTVSCTASECTYTPAADFAGDDSFTYTVSDGALQATATVTVHVTPVNDPPSAAPVTVTVTAGGTVSFDLLAGAIDIDGDSLTVESYTQPSHGTVTCTPAGSCTYVPAPGYVGPDSFTFVVTDGKAATAGLAGDGSLAATAQGTVSITVTAAPATTTTTRPRTIPTTGGRVAPSLGLALLMLVLGFFVVAAARRRRRV